MLTGFEYVVSAYVIWVFTFAVYIIMTKRRMRRISLTLEAINQRISESSDRPDKTVHIENQD
tara:strand:- start:138 stop:323 length:186 start_codon:yes stop_codon:yes gene_type:complete